MSCERCASLEAEIDHLRAELERRPLPWGSLIEAVEDVIGLLGVDHGPEFTIDEVEDALDRIHPELGTRHGKSAGYVLRRLVKRGDIEVVSPGNNKKRTVYRRRSQ